MANNKHIEVLMQGLYLWNEWRAKNPDIVPDLSGVSFYRMFLYKANLTKANLKMTHLVGTNLARADLTDADLTGANLTSANLTETNLVRAELNGSFLNNANFAEANLSGANLRDAVLIGTNFGGALLANARNLDKCQHRGPSIIDHRTILKSENIPVKFLRGCGLPDSLIEFFLSPQNKPIQFNSCFISYSSKDQEFVQQIYADLQDNGIRSWFAPEDMKIGDKIRDTIDQAIHHRDKLLLVLSKNSIDSEWVEKEVETAFEEEQKRKRTVLFPIRLDSAVMDTNKAWAADIRRTRHIGNFTQWKERDAYQKVLDRLLHDIKEKQI